MNLKSFPWEELEERLGVRIKNKKIFLEALTHKSYLHFHPYHLSRDNERLEFLGDALLEFFISYYLFRKYAQLSEGELTLIRASLVNRDRLLLVAENLNLEKFMFFEKIQGAKGLKTVLANGVEAIIGALFLSNGLLAVKKFVEKNFLTDLEIIINQKLYKDPKSRLQEIIQEKYKLLPRYVVLKEEGKPHQKRFRVGIYLKQRLLSVAGGESKQEAEIKAALKALKKGNF